jgi:predicted transposase/invertase (TIGR01784 family)
MTIKEKYIDPFTDFGFKHIFGTEKNKKFLISFLNNLLDLKYQIVDLEYRSLEKLGLKISDRKAIFDVYCTDTEDNKFIVELQRSQQQYFKDRSVYYTTFPIQEQAKKGSWNYELTKVYFVGILEFAFDDNKLDDKYLTKAKIIDCDTKEVFYDKLTYYYLQMPKFRKTEQELSTQLDKWLYYLNNLNDLTQIPKTLEKESIFKEAFDVAEFLALDSDKQFAYQQDLKARWDNKACLDFAKNKGKMEGLEQGKKERNIEIAKLSLSQGLDINTISIITELTIEEIQKLSKS